MEEASKPCWCGRCACAARRDGRVGVIVHQYCASGAVHRFAGRLFDESAEPERQQRAGDRFRRAGQRDGRRRARWLPFPGQFVEGPFRRHAARVLWRRWTRCCRSSGAGRTNLGDGDADVEVTSAGTVLLADLDIIFNAALNNAQLGVSVTRCPAARTGPPALHDVVSTRQAPTARGSRRSGPNAWLSYHDSGSSSLIQSSARRTMAVPGRRSHRRFPVRGSDGRRRRSTTRLGRSWPTL